MDELERLGLVSVCVFVLACDRVCGHVSARSVEHTFANQSRT